jgi:manganese-dependent ADP-ribose/CDP-alcohol diphosphatase
VGEVSSAVLYIGAKDRSVMFISQYNLSLTAALRRFARRFFQTGDLVGYYSIQKSDYRFIFLDNYDETVLSRTGPKKAAAEQILSKKNPNYAKGDINSPYPGTGLNRRFVAFNGGIGPTQMNWLRSQLELARKRGEKVVVSSHQPLHPKTTAPICLPFNYPEILKLLQKFNDVVVLTLSGHTHSNGYIESKGIHHIVVPAALESKPPIQTFAILEIYEDRIEVLGEGDCQSGTIMIEETGEKGGKRKRKGK